MSWKSPCTAIIIIVILLILVFCCAINFQKFLKFIKYLNPKMQKPSTLLFAEKSIRPVTVIQFANKVSNNKKIQNNYRKTNEFSPALIVPEKNTAYDNLQIQPVGSYLIKNTGP